MTRYILSAEVYCVCVEGGRELKSVTNLSKCDHLKYITAVIGIQMKSTFLCVLSESTGRIT